MGKTGPSCTICTHERRHLIEVGLVHRTPLRVLAQRFQCSPDALHRHRHRHLSPAMAAAILAARQPSEVDLGALERGEAEGLLAQLVTQRARLQQHSDAALEQGHMAGAVAAERAITSNLELVAKLLGQLTQRYETMHTSILISSDYLALRACIVGALKGHPEAARAVGAALHELETNAAKAITASKRPLILEGTMQ